MCPAWSAGASSPEVVLGAAIALPELQARGHKTRDENLRAGLYIYMKTSEYL
jgi:hypothetical protein